ncbi:helix-turn-helix transcriptional regulator [Luteolibacter pohnpeiensis]|uniref:Helix-turn-helix transcriptional regulator n=1 Tax=Luteolibacter pohnpeiensis TaxID=454153 RepID=A0A934VUU1_9BACT|nr:AraC family transcriptional regulator [Luteolibacter pohnpeiensis]MBK1882892.1 helix-turn-helix transcriptional regulator [Luteolibacter pohnpeiensis]
MSLHFILNQSGEGVIIGPTARLTLLPQSLAIFQTVDDRAEVTATRFVGNEVHRFLVLSLSADTVARIFRGGVVIPGKNYGLLRRWTERERLLYEDMQNVPVPEAAYPAWFQAKVLEILSLHLFHHKNETQPLFCTEIKNLVHRHVRDALQLLRGRLDLPLDLSQLASDVGCAPHYLSRLVSQETSKPLSLHLREMRIEKAVELLAGNRLNVTEVALQVGYSSLSHFSKAFALEKGMTPSDFLKRQRL